MAASIRRAYDLGKQHAIVVVAEGATLNGDALVQGFIVEKDNLGFELRLTKLGHVQRGGIPTVVDRQLGTLAGAAAVQSLLKGESGVVFGQRERQVESLPLSEVAGRKKELDLSLLELGRLLAT